MELNDREKAVILDALLIAQAHSPDEEFRNECNRLADAFEDETD